MREEKRHRKRERIQRETERQYREWCNIKIDWDWMKWLSEVEFKYIHLIIVVVVVAVVIVVVCFNTTHEIWYQGDLGHAEHESEISFVLTIIFGFSIL